MKKEIFNKVFYITISNLAISILLLFIYKMFRFDYDITVLIQSMHEGTKRFALNLLVVFLLCLVTVKWELKLFNYLKEKFPWGLTILKLFLILFISLATSFAANYYFQYFQHLLDPVATVNWIMDNFSIYFVGGLYLAFLSLLLFALIGNVFISTLVSSIVFIGLGFIHYNKLNIRSEPLYPYDYKQLYQMGEVMPMISEYVSMSQIVIALIFLLVVGVMLVFLRNIGIALWMRGIILVISLTMVYSLTFFQNTFMKSFVTNSNINVVKWNQIENYQINGFLIGFISNFQNETYKKPEGYTKKNVQEIAWKYMNSSENLPSQTGTPPNIIYLMSESFWDPTRLDVELSQDPMPHLRGLMDGHSSGNILSPVFGGATANVEFEALTGFSTAFLNAGVLPFQDIIDQKSFVPNIVSDLKRKGYSSLAIHPFNRVFYKRNIVYNTFGFDEFLDQDTMRNRDREPGRVIQDIALTQEIIDHIKEQDKPLFIHAVSMQNHMPYNPGGYEDSNIKVEGLSDESAAILGVYSEGIRKSDEALQVLIDELEKLGEPSMVVFWGDHLPILGANRAIYKEAGYEDPDPNINEYKYSVTPLLIYTNFEAERKQLESISPFYLAPVIYEISGLKKPAFYNLLDKLREEMGISALKGNLIMGSDQEFIAELTQEQSQLIEDYKLLQYDLLMGKQYSLEILYQ
jgi:phosphoglycerol transferase MdoB-like AlkP superfamily enzyme